MDQTKKSKRRYCIACGCFNSKSDIPDLAFFKLPRDPDRCREWLINIEREDLLAKKKLKHDSYEVCSSHFDDSALKLVKKLKVDAVPIRRCHKNGSESSSSTTSKKRKLSYEQTATKSTNIQVSYVRSEKPDATSIGTQTEKEISLIIKENEMKQKIAGTQKMNQHFNSTDLQIKKEEEDIENE